MLINPSHLGMDELRCQVCIIGAGAAGVAAALELGKQKIEVVLVAGGGFEENEADRKLHEGTADPARSHEPLTDNRCRAFGGGTKIWGGRLVPFDPIDFENRPFVPMGGWPISYECVARNLPRAAELCEVASDKFRQAGDKNEFDLPDTLGNGNIDTTSCERWSPPTDFGVHYRPMLSAMTNVRVLIDYHAADLKLNDELQNVSSVSLVSRNGRPIRVTADVFILATGGIENARILLASRSQLAEGVGNQTDMVGRCYMSHLAGTYGYVNLRKKKKPSFYRLQRDAQGNYFRRRFRLTDEAQRELQVMNIIAFPCRPEPADPCHRDAVLSMLYLQDCLKRTPGVDQPSWSVIRRHIANCILNSPAAWFSAFRQTWLRAKRPRLPFILPQKAKAQDALFFQGEHAPNPDSRLVLGEERDDFGTPRITPQVRFSEIDDRTVREFYRQLDFGLRSEELGYLEYNEASLDEYLEGLKTRFDSFAHHFGTTRMSESPKLGVVDTDCKVHSVNNLYIAGASVFPTSGHANPTLTLLALTLRLTDHLANQIRTCVSANVQNVPLVDA